MTITKTRLKQQNRLAMKNEAEIDQLIKLTKESFLLLRVEKT